MAWRNDDDDEGKVSDWNAAALKMKRLDRELTSLNEINGNLWAFNQEYGVYNYELKFKICDNLYLEVENKLTEEERHGDKENKDSGGGGEGLRQKIKIMMEKYPVYTIVKSNFARKSVSRKDVIVLKILETLLFEYEKLIKKFLDDHGLDTSYGDDFDGL